MCSPMNSKNLPNATSSPESASGATPCDRQDGQMIGRSGRDPAHANLSARQAKAAGLMTSGTYGQPSTGSSSSASRQSCLESRSQRVKQPAQTQQYSGEGICTHCGEEKKPSDFSKTGWKGTYRKICKECRNILAKEWRDSRKGTAAHKAQELVRGAKERAKKKGLPFNLTTKWAEAILENGYCQLSGLPFDLNSTPRAWNCPSLDQIMPGGGYTVSNTRIVLFSVNTGCGTWGENTLLRVALSITEKRRKRSDELSRRLGEKLKQKTDQLGSSLYNLTWKDRATPAGRLLPQLVASVRRIKESDCTGPERAPWASPIRGNAKGTYYNRYTENGIEQGRSQMLQDQVQLAAWPTPAAMGDTTGGASMDDAMRAIAGEPRPSGAQRGTKLKEMVMLAAWPTPASRDWKDSPGMATEATNPDGSKRMRLDQLARVVNLATPARLTASGEMLTGSSAGMESGGQLNPCMSRWLMSLPVAWDIAALAIDTRSIRSSKKRKTASVD